MRFSFLPRVSAGSRITQTVSAGSHFSLMVDPAGSKSSWTVSAEAKYDGQSLQEAKISGISYTLSSWTSSRLAEKNAVSEIACTNHIPCIFRQLATA